MSASTADMPGIGGPDTSTAFASIVAREPLSGEVHQRGGLGRFHVGEELLSCMFEPRPHEVAPCLFTAPPDLVSVRT